LPLILFDEFWLYADERGSHMKDNHSAIRKINSFLIKSMGWLTFLMIILTFSGTVLRYVGRSIGTNLTWSAAIDLQWYIFSVVFLMLASYNIFHDSNVRVDIFYSKFSDKIKSLVDVLGLTLFVLPFSFLIIYVSWPFVINSITVFEGPPDPGGLPRWIIKPLIPIAFMFVFLQASYVAWKHVLFLCGKSDTPPIKVNYEEEI
jgi:TRAP-type mannitol/chloroaromatic compound transport system permease small subunit